MHKVSRLIINWAALCGQLLCQGTFHVVFGKGSHVRYGSQLVKGKQFHI